jgi:hypothetical protein
LNWVWKFSREAGRLVGWRSNERNFHVRMSTEGSGGHEADGLRKMSPAVGGVTRILPYVICKEGK